MLWHAHNLFVGQILQTGIIGLALFLGLLAALCARFVRYLRHGDDALAIIGVLGLSLVAGFVAKNMTDDFLFRSNAKEFWALLALLVGFGTRLELAPPGSLRRSPETERSEAPRRTLHGRAPASGAVARAP